MKDHRVAGLAIGIIVLVLVAYSTAIGGGFIWDDDDYVTENRTLRSLSGLGAIWFDPSATPQYYPLVHSSFWIEYQLWELWPAGYHLVNVLIHALSSLLLWRLLVRLGVPAAGFASLVFAIHPVHVESVAWITERKNVLSGCFYLSAALCFLRYWDFTQPESESEPTRRRWYFAALACFLFALWSKTVAATLPAAILVMIWWKRGRITWNNVIVLAPMFVLGIALGLLTVWLEKHQVGASGIDWELSFADRCLIAGRAILFYAAKLVWPASLTFNYPRWEIDSSQAWQFAFPAAVLVVMIVLWAMRNRIGRGPLAATLFFAGTLFPALGFFDVYPMRFSFVADHFQYLASIGVITLVVAAGKLLLDRAELPWLPKTVACGVAIALCMLTWQQGKIYEGLEVLWRDTLAKNPTAFLAHNNLGALLNRRGDYEEAEQHLREAVRLKPDFVDSVVNLAKAREGQSDLAEAESLYRQATELNPQFAPAFNGLGAVYGMTGRAELSEKSLRQALQLDPNYPTAHANLATLYTMQGKADEAVTEFEAALRLDPSLHEVKANLARVLIAQQKFDRAKQVLKEVLADNPRHISALLNLGVIAGNENNYWTAVGYFEDVVQLQPSHLQANYNLGAMYGMLGETEKSNHYFQQYSRLSGQPPPPAP